MRKMFSSSKHPDLNLMSFMVMERSRDAIGPVGEAYGGGIIEMGLDRSGKLLIPHNGDAGLRALNGRHTTRGERGRPDRSQSDAS
jgi:hypothetical protein